MIGMWRIIRRNVCGNLKKFVKNMKICVGNTKEYVENMKSKKDMRHDLYFLLKESLRAETVQ